MARQTRSSAGAAEPLTSHSAVKVTPSKSPAARKPSTSASRPKSTRGKAEKHEERDQQPVEEQPVEERHVKQEPDQEDVNEPPRKRRKAPAVILLHHQPKQESPTAEDRKSAKEKRTMHIGKKFSPGNGQMDYTLTAPEPTRDQDGTFHFDDYPHFLPNLSPEEILRQGSFGGGYFRPIKSQHSGREIHDDWSDLPSEWWQGLDSATHLTQPEPDGKANKWEVKVGQPYEEWEKAGWLVPEHDARGWFQWYCRFFRGRRVGEHDDNEIGRWVRCADVSSGRWARIFYGKCQKSGVYEIERNEETVSKGIRQTLNHWAYEPTTEHLLRYLDEKGVGGANSRRAGDRT